MRGANRGGAGKICHPGCPLGPRLKIIRIEKEAVEKAITITAHSQKPVKCLGAAGQLF